MSGASARLGVWVTHVSASSGLDAFKSWVDVAGTLITSIAVIVGGLWVYFKFISGRTLKPRVEIEMSAKWQEAAGKRWLQARVRVRNIGTSKISLKQAGTGLRVSVLGQRWPPETPPARAPWAWRGMYSILAGHSWIEPGETVSDDLLLDLGLADPLPTLLECYLILPRKFLGDIETSAREIMPVNAALIPRKEWEGRSSER